jgi:hypothetical protein
MANLGFRLLGSVVYLSLSLWRPLTLDVLCSLSKLRGCVYKVTRWEKTIKGDDSCKLSASLNYYFYVIMTFAALPP